MAFSRTVEGRLQGRLWSRPVGSVADSGSDWTKLPRIHACEGMYTLETSNQVTLDRDTSHYLQSVLRKKEGAQVRVFNARDGEFVCTMAAAAMPKRNAPVTLEVNERIRLPFDPAQEQGPPPPVLYFGIIKRTRLKILLEKASELGVRHLVPIVTKNAQSASVALTPQAVRRLLVESAEQCERLDVATLHAPMHLSDLLDCWATGTGLMGVTEAERSAGVPPAPLLVCQERAPAAPPLLRAVMSGAETGAHSLLTKRVLIGPEGGFSHEELRDLSRHSFVQFVSLGCTVLRAETAGVVALATIMAATDAGLE